MTRLFTLLAVIAGAILGWIVPLDRVIATVSPLVVTFSIMAAAILVRMNRGMPSIDWKSLQQVERESLTGRIVKLTREYLVILSLQAVTLVILIALGVLNTEPNSPLTCVPDVWKHAIGAVTGFLLVLSFARMGYVVWRDYDIVKLQKQLIDGAGRRDAQDQNSAEATSRVAAMRTSGLHALPNPAPKDWDE